MGRGRFFFRAQGTGDVRLKAAAVELEAARILVLNLHQGARPACIHLVRAAALLDWAWGEDSDPAGSGVEEGGEDLRPGTLPGLDMRQRRELEAHFPLVRGAADPLSPDAPAEGREVERSARIVHDLLERALLAACERGAGRWPDSRLLVRAVWPLLGTLIALGAVVGGAVLLLHRTERPSREQEGGPPAVGRPLEVPVAKLATPLAEGTPWDAPGTVRIPPGSGGLVVRLEHRSTAKRIQLSLDNNDRYRIEFLDGATRVGQFEVGPTADRTGLTVYERDVPGTAVTRGFDALRIVPEDGDGAYSVGHLLLNPPVSGGRPGEHPSGGASGSP